MNCAAVHHSFSVVAARVVCDPPASILRDGGRHGADARGGRSYLAGGGLRSAVRPAPSAEGSATEPFPGVQPVVSPSSHYRRVYSSRRASLEKWTMLIIIETRHTPSWPSSTFGRPARRWSSPRSSSTPLSATRNRLAIHSVRSPATPGSHTSACTKSPAPERHAEPYRSPAPQSAVASVRSDTPSGWCSRPNWSASWSSLLIGGDGCSTIRSSRSS